MGCQKKKKETNEKTNETINERINERIITALDFARFPEAQAAVDRLADAVFFKVGLEAFLAYGDAMIAYLKSKNKKLFLDLKFKDIPNTVQGAIKSAMRFNPQFLTIHLSGGAEMIKRSVEAAQEAPDLTILGVTVLTSLSDGDLKEIGDYQSVRETVLRLCELGLKNGIKGFVCSPVEIEPIRQHFGSEPILVTPGIRPQGSEKGDQKRVFTPQMAIESGSNYLVIGRPITQADDPQDAFHRILNDITVAVRNR
ncbi:MAG: orotidine-5'-phosphate decarboxylase [Candidatus Omnitrophota bacterium]